MAQPEGAAHGQHEIADLHPVAVAQAARDQIGRRDGHHGHVGVGVLQTLLGWIQPTVGQIDLDVRGRAPRITCRLVST